MRDHPTAPYGRPPVSSIPVPPLRDEAEVRAFRHMLGVYIASFGRERGVGLGDFALCAAADTMAITDAAGALTPGALRLSMAVAFPVPWTPVALFRAIVQSGSAGGAPTSAEPGELVLRSDPTMRALRDRSGAWRVTLSERGEDRIEAELGGDDDMVLWLNEWGLGFRRPYPFGWTADGSDVAALAAAARAAHTAFDRHAALPYLEGWRTGEG